MKTIFRLLKQLKQIKWCILKFYNSRYIFKHRCKATTLHVYCIKTQCCIATICAIFRNKVTLTEVHMCYNRTVVKLHDWTPLYYFRTKCKAVPLHLCWGVPGDICWRSYPQFKRYNTRCDTGTSSLSDVSSSVDKRHETPADQLGRWVWASTLEETGQPPLLHRVQF
jgi:hypothetical protein